MEYSKNQIQGSGASGKYHYLSGVKIAKTVNFILLDVHKQ